MKKVWEFISDFTQSEAGCFLIVVFSIWSVVSILFGGYESVVYTGCKYESLISRINIPYIVSCELWEPRFKK